MRTSKKLLSFFLAVVMVVTTCSVGFTAFAKSNDNPLWQTTGVDADSAFSTLNKLADNLPSLLMGIDVIKNAVYEKGAKELGKTVDELTDAEKEQIESETTLQDLLGVLQPTLIGALASTSQSDFVRNIYGDTTTGDLSSYNYLSGSTGSVDYYTLAALCYNYKDNSSLSKESREQLEEWLYGAKDDRTLSGRDASGKTVKYSANSLWYLATLYQQQAGNDEEIIAKIDAIGRRYDQAFKDKKIFNLSLDGETYIGSTYETASLYQLKQCDFALTAEDQAVVDDRIAVYNKMMDVYGIGVKVNDVAELLYYGFGMGASAVQSSLYIKLIQDGGLDFTASVEESGIIGAPLTMNGFKINANENNIFARVEAGICASIGVDNIASAIKMMMGMDESDELDDATLNTLSNFLIDGVINADLLNTALLEGDVSAYKSSYYPYLLKGLAVNFGNNGEPMSLDEINASIDAQFPKGYSKDWKEGDAFFISDEELDQLHDLLNNIGWNNALDKNGNGKTLVTDLLGDGTVTFTDSSGDGAKKTIKVPDSLKGSGTLDFWYQISNLYSRSAIDTSGASLKTNNYISLVKAFAGDYPREVRISSTEYTASNSLVDYSNSDEGTGINKIENSTASYSKADIQKWADNSYNYIVTKTLSKNFGIDTSELGKAKTDAYQYDEKFIMNDLIDIDTVFNKIVAQKTAIQTDVVLTDDQKAILNGDNTDLTGSVGTEIVNLILNNTIGDIVDPNTSTGSIVDSVLKSLLKTEVNLQAVLTDVWSDLVDNPIRTVVNLLPVLAVLVNELIEPILFAEAGDAQKSTNTGLLYDVLGDGALESMNAKSGSYIGIGQLSWDLNSLLPQLMHWLKNDNSFEAVGGTYWNDGNKKTGYLSYYGSNGYETKDYTANDLISNPNLVLKYDKVLDKNGKELTYTKNDDGTYTYSYNGNTADNLTDVLANIPGATRFNVQYTYEAGVPRITGIYIADKALKYAKISDLKDILSGAITTADGQIGTGLYEVVDELATLFTKAVDTYVNTPELRNQVKGYANDGTGAAVNKGLNNITVALPQLFDIMENLGADKYSVPQNAWTYCYDGKIVVGKDASTGDDGVVSNAKMTEFKYFAANPDPVKIFDCFAQIFVEDWIDAILSLVNNVISVDDSEFSKNLPIITGLLNSVGGFGESSALTDLFNSIFQITRESDYSFTFEKQSSGFVGLDKDNAYFLITNVSKLVDVIKALIDSFKQSGDDNGNGDGTTSLSAIAKKAVVANADTSAASDTTMSPVDLSNYTNDEIGTVDKTIANLDSMLSSLLVDSSINGYNLSKTSNIVTGVISLLSNYIGADASNQVIDLLNTYLYYLNGEDQRSADSDGNVDPKDIYTNEGLTTVVVRTFALVETLVANLTDKYAYTYTYKDNGSDKEAKYNLISEAVNGLISPDSLAVRIKETEFGGASKQIKKLASWSDAIEKDGTINVDINWGITKGDRDEFLSAFSASIRILTSIAGVILLDTGIYENALYPALNAIAQQTGIKIDTPEELADASNEYRDELVKGLVNPLVSWLDTFLQKPATTLINTIIGLSAVLDDTNTKAGTVASIVSGAVTPVQNELNGAANILKLTSSDLGALSPTLASLLEKVSSDTFDQFTKVNGNQELGFKVNDVALSGNNIIPILNTILAQFNIKLNNINWNLLSKCTPAQAIIYVLEYLVDTVLSNDNLSTIANLIGNDTITAVLDAVQSGKIDAHALLKVLNKVLNLTQNPTLFAWSFEQYLQQAAEGFAYPQGITKAQANEAAQDIDAVINNIFPVLASLGVDLGGNNLKDILSSNVFKNDLITTIVKAIYGGVSGNATVANVMNALGVASSPSAVATLLTDASYGVTYSDAASAIASAASWDDVKNINWGFTDGAANAQQGFVNALVAALRPLYPVVSILLNEGSAEVGAVVSEILKTIDSQTETLTFKNGVLTITVKDANNADSKDSVIKIDVNSALKELKLYGTNAYNSAIIPLMEALGAKNIKTDAEYKNDIAAAKDNLLLDILNPILGADNSILNDIVANPLETICTMLPNLAVFIDANGLSQFVANLIAPITQVLYSLSDVLDVNSVLSYVLGYYVDNGSFDGMSADDIVAVIAGTKSVKPLGDVVGKLIGMGEGKLTIDLSDLSTLNLQDAVIPALNTLLASLLGSDVKLQLEDIDWNFLASLGDRVTYTSKATDLDGNALTGKKLENVDYGKTLITVLRYVLDTVKNNINTIESLLSNIDAIAKNDTISGILTNVFTQIKTHTTDQIITAIYYFFVGNNTPAYWDYTGYQYQADSFTYPNGVTEKSIASLISLIDNVVAGVDIQSILNDNLYTDSLINILAKAIYTNIESVKINDTLSLGDILALLDINVTANSFADLLVNSKYGETAQFKSASDAIKAAGSFAKVDFDKLSWGVKDQETFLNALVAVLRPIYGVLDVVIADGQLNILEGISIPGSNGYENSIVPLLEAIGCENIVSYKQYLKDVDKAYDNLLLDILNPLFGFVDKVVASPINTIGNAIPNLALFIGNNGITQLAVNLVTPITSIVTAINPVIDVDVLLNNLLGDKLGGETISVVNLGDFLGKYVNGDTLVGTINKLLASTGLQLPEINWIELASLGTTSKAASAVKVIGDRLVVDANVSEVLVHIFGYLINTATTENNVTALKNLINNDTASALLDAVASGKINLNKLITLISKVLSVTTDPTLLAWSFANYLTQAIEGFYYPQGMTKAQADEAAADIDLVINNIFPLLKTLGIDLGGSDLSGILNAKLFTNELITKLVFTIYGGISSNATVASVMAGLGVVSSPADVAKLLTDTSYGATFTDAANLLASASSWDALVKSETKNKCDCGEANCTAGTTTTKTYPTINWGFKDGAANAQQGFVNALVAALRPMNGLVSVFFNENSIDLGNAVPTILSSIDLGDKVKVENNVLTADLNGTALTIDLSSLSNLKVYGTNGYNSAVIPLLEALGANNIKTYAEFKADVAKAKDNVLLDVLNPIVGADNSVLSQIVAKPLEAICTILPNLAVFLDAEGLSQFLNNLLAPVTQIIAAVNEVFDLNAVVAELLNGLFNNAATDAIANDVINALAGKSNKNLGDVIAAKLGMAKGSLNVDLANISAINVSDAVVPAINFVLSDPSIIKASEKSTTSCPCSSSKCPNKLTDAQIKENKAANETSKKIIGYVHQIKIGSIDWNFLASLGDRVTYTSKATDLNGKALTGKKLENVDAGKTLITVLRYVLNTVKNNIDPLNSILTNIDAIAKNDTLKAIISNVITQIKTHSADQIIVGIYYFFVGEATDAYWDFTGYKTKNSTFKFPKGVNASDVTALVSFLDGIIGEVDLDALLNQYLYTDSLINTLTKAIYTNIENVKINDSISLGDILSILDVDVTNKGVAKLLVDTKYGETKQFASASKAINKAESWAKVDFDKLSWGVKDQKTFLNALVAVLRPLYGVLDAILADGNIAVLEGVTIPGSNAYENSIVPLLEAIGCEKIASFKQYKKDIDKAYDNLLLDILNPLFGFVDSVVSSPLETIAQALPNLALFIGNDGITQFVVNLVTPVTQVVKAVAPVIDVDALLYDLTKIELNGKKISITKLDKFIGQYTNGGKLIATVNSFLTTTGISIPEIDWLGLASLGKTTKTSSAVKTIGKRLVVKADTSKVIIAVLRYALDAVLSNAKAIKGLLGDSYKGTLKNILDMVFGMNADQLLALVFRLVNITQSPTEVFWSYKEYKYQATKFTYPDGISAEDAANAVTQLDGAVDGVMALLNSLGVLSSSNLQGVVSELLFTNETVTKLASALYGALDTDKISPYLSMAGIDVTTEGVAKLLTDKSYGKTFTSAAKTIKSAKSWSKVTKVNWGFANGAANAQQGFINAVTAVLRPFLGIVGPFLDGSNLELGNILYGVVVGLDINTGNKKKGETLVSLKNGKLTIKTQSNGKYSTALSLNLANLETLKTLNLFGSNGYENAIVPLLDVLQVDNSQIKTFDQYVKDCEKAKDNILLDVLNPLMSFVSNVLDKPFDTLTSVLPNLAYFIDNGGVPQLLDNLLSPVTAFLKDAKKQGVDIDKIIKMIAGNDLGTIITKALKINGVKLNLSLTNLKACNIDDIVYPLVTSLLKSTGIVLPYFDFATIASHGEAVTSTSKAENAEGKFTNKEVIGNKGEVLVALLRYISDTLIKNAKTLKSLLTNIGAIKSNDMLKSIITSVFNTIGIAEKDDIVRAIFYFLKSEPTNAFWDYTAYKTGTFDFSYPEGMDTDFLKNLPPMLDGLVGGLLDLNATIGGLIFKDDIINSLATGLYGAIEGVKVGDGSLVSLLAQTGIDFSTKNVAKLLTDEAYGQTYDSQAQIIAAAGSWAKVNKDSLKWGVKDADTFFHALAAVLRPIYGVLDVLLNDASLGIFNIVRIPGSNGYTSSIVPLMEAFSMYNIKTQYQYRQDIKEAYDNILLDIINPLWDKVEDILSAPLETLFAMLPNLALFIGNDGLCQIIDNLLTPVSALVDAIKPVVNLNDLLTAVLSALNVDLNSLLGKIGITNFNLDIYDLNATLKPILGGDAIIPLVNNILGLIKISGTPLGLKLNDVNWLQLASHGKTVVSASQAATYGARIYVEGDSSETLIAVLRYLIETVNAGDNFDKINDLIGGLLGDGANSTVSDVVNQVLGMLQGDTDQVISDLVDLLQTLA